MCRLTTPGEEGSNDKHRVQNHVEREREIGRNTGGLKELNTLTDQILTTEQLHSKSHHDDLGPSPIDTSEAVDVAGTKGGLDLEFSSMFHHGDSVVAIVFADKVGIRQSLNGILGIFHSTLSNQPPG